MTRLDAPDFEEIAEHMLAIIDVWGRPEMGVAAKSRRLDAVTSMIKACYGAFKAESTTLRLLFEFDGFDERLSQDRCEPDQFERNKFLAQLLRSEFHRRGSRYLSTSESAG